MPALREPVFYSIPARAPAVPCKSCGVPLFFVLTEKGKRMPVDCSGENEKAPDEISGGVGQSHFSRCPDAAKFRKTR